MPDSEQTGPDLAELSAALMRASLATAQAWTASVCQGLSLWSAMMGAPLAVAPGAERRSTLPSGQTSRVPPARAEFWNPWDAALAAWSPKSADSRALAFGFPEPVGWLAITLTLAMPLANPHLARSERSLADMTRWFAFWPLLSPPALLDGKDHKGPQAPFATYRSDGGHAVAQVMIPTTNAFLAALTAALPFSDMRPWMSAWRHLLNG
jgi:hypothetical protein